MKRALVSLILSLAVLAGLFSTALAQSNTLELHLSRNFGFSSGQQIQGSFKVFVTGRNDLASVTYLVDTQEIGTVTQSPFNLDFSTDNYPTGAHKLSATAKTTGGQTLNSQSIDVEIVTASEGWQSAGRIAIPLMGVVLLLVFGTFAFQMLPFGGKKRFEPGVEHNYGVAGGAICGKCGRPYALSFMAPNLLTGKLARCPYCGHVTIARRAPLEALRAAEKAEVSSAPVLQEETEEERLRRQIEESRLTR